MNSIAGTCEHPGILERGRGDALLSIMKYVDVTRNARPGAVDGYATGDKAFRITPAGEKAKNLRLQSRNRHGQPFQSARRDAARSYRPRCAGDGQPTRLARW